MKRNQPSSISIENKKIKSIKYENDDYEDKENMNNTNYVPPMKLKIGIANLKPEIVKESKQQDTKKVDDIDDGYETDETVLEEDYVPPANYKPPKSPYQTYLEMREAKLKSYPEGYETDDTVILDDEGNEKMGGKRKNTRRKKYRKHIKKTKTLKKRNKTNKKYKMLKLKLRSKSKKLNKKK